MSQRAKSLLVRYGVTIAVGALIGLGIFSLRGGFETTVPLKRFMALCDAFSVPGVLLIMFSGLVFVSGEGIFDGISYAVRHALKSLIPGALARGEQEKYGDYVERRRAKGKPKGYACLFFVGLAYLLVSIVLIAIYYNLK